MNFTAPYTVRNPIYHVGELIVDYGTKYCQKFGPHTPENVQPIEGETDGIRLEDFTFVEIGIHKINNPDILLVCMADGHGSIPAYDGNGGNKKAERQIGGYEIASLVVKSTRNFIHGLSDTCPFKFLTKEGVQILLEDSFSYAQEKCTEETHKGARKPGDTKPFIEQRLSELVTSEIDGQHFNDLYIKKTLSENPGQDPKCIIVDKIIEKYKDKEEVVFYIDGTGKIKQLAEYGSTLTTCLFIPVYKIVSPTIQEVDFIRLYVAHAGDSDVYVFSKQNGVYIPNRATTNHSNTNSKEIERMEQHNMVPQDVYFHLDKGPFKGYRIMPSRSLGHTMLKHHGIIHNPIVTYCELRPTDFIVIATDGLWSCFGDKQEVGHKNFTPQSMEDCSAYRVSRIITINQQDHPTQIGKIIQKELRNHCVENNIPQDNTSIVVIRV